MLATRRIVAASVKRFRILAPVQRIEAYFCSPVAWLGSPLPGQAGRGMRRGVSLPRVWECPRATAVGVCFRSPSNLYTDHHVCRYGRDTEGLGSRRSCI
jgi:hypothetical protein